MAFRVSGGPFEGSSPRGRGKPGYSLDRRCPVGLIPARAGKTSKQAERRASERAHPRAGGENDEYAPPPLALDGSSPRGRGKPHDPRVPGRRRRLIPARAGKTILRALRPGLGSAHPRAGGENATSFFLRDRGSGSSPRGRGKRRWRRHWSTPPRLIPARAGKTGRREGR